ncbi:MAG: sulfate adenylyltransferase [Deltaproteobacteria bacterium]|nr:sulfate adenylyltransferase [Deltaproteobacteria bacterium]
MSAIKKPKALLRVTTAGSVDDGKSTLIGRLLYEADAILDDQLRSIERGANGPDLSLVTDGLKSEREQGITIDVAYKYFASAKTKFILADAPGHLQYTRNMVTAASTADVGIILVDARQGLTEQTRRHAYILHLLGVSDIILAINKVDLVGYDRARIQKISVDFRSLSWHQESCSVHVIPISALTGANVTKSSAYTPWYDGPPLATLLDDLAAAKARHLDVQPGFTLPLQHVVRSRHGKRIALGTIASGSLRPGDRVRVLPTGTTSNVAALWRNGNVTTEATTGDSVAVSLSDERDLERGYIITPEDHLWRPTGRFKANLVWFDDQPWERDKSYLLRTGTQRASAQISEIDHKFDLASLTPVPAGELSVNDIATVSLELSRDLYVSAFRDDRRAGSFILVDKENFRTVAAGMITQIQDKDLDRHSKSSQFSSLGLTALEVQILDSLREQGWDVSLRRRPALTEHR